MDAYYIPFEVDDVEAFRLAHDWLYERRGDSPLLVYPVVDSLHNRELARLAGQPWLRAGSPGQRVTAGWLGGAVAAAWPSRKTLADLSERRPTAVLVICGARSAETAPWIAAHQAVDLTGDGTAGAAPTLADPVVIAAMRSLTRTMELGGRGQLLTPYDRDLAILALRLLVRQGHRVDADEIYTFALASGCSHEGAERLRILATEVLEGKQHRLGGTRRAFGPDVYAAWQREASES